MGQDLRNFAVTQKILGFQYQTDEFCYKLEWADFLSMPQIVHSTLITDNLIALKVGDRRLNIWHPTDSLLYQTSNYGKSLKSLVGWRFVTVGWRLVCHHPTSWPSVFVWLLRICSFINLGSSFESFVCSMTRELNFAEYFSYMTLKLAVLVFWFNVDWPPFKCVQRKFLQCTINTCILSVIHPYLQHCGFVGLF